MSEDGLEKRAVVVTEKEKRAIADLSERIRKAEETEREEKSKNKKKE